MCAFGPSGVPFLDFVPLFLDVSLLTCFILSFPSTLGFHSLPDLQLKFCLPLTGSRRG